jgi:ribosome-binding protein aMBF1 (putative translation factor)
MLTPEQSRAARGWLGWSQVDLAARAELGLGVLGAFEAGELMPAQGDLRALQGALEEAGIEFLHDAAVGLAGIVTSVPVRPIPTSRAG